jgi:hypothetical protein
LLRAGAALGGIGLDCSIKVVLFSGAPAILVIAKPLYARRRRPGPAKRIFYIRVTIVVSEMLDTPMAKRESVSQLNQSNVQIVFEYQMFSARPTSELSQARWAVFTNGAEEPLLVCHKHPCKQQFDRVT